MLLPLFVAVTFGLPSFQLSPQEWSRLNATVNGRLIQLAPFARPCFEQVGESVRGSFSPEECDSIVASYVDHSARLPALGQYMNTQWETCQSTEEQCLLDWTNSSNADAFSSRSCHQGSVPHYAVRVQSASDVAAAFRFSDEQKVPLVVKSTGHDYLGRSSGAGTLAILTDGLQELVLDRAFIPKGCPAGTKSKLGLTMGAGVTTQTIMDFAEDNHITIPTPGDGTVALGAGYTLAGGHSILANAFGLAADRALEFEVVTPDGKLLIANQCQNMDLFFALRGGGGGTFGVVLKTTTLAFPGMPIPSINITLPITPENQRAHIDFLVQHSLELSLQGWGGYSLPAVCMTTLANPLLNDTAAHASADVLKSFAESHGGTFTYIYEPSYKHYYDDFEPPVAVGAQVALSSRLIPTDMFRSSPSRSQLSDAIFDLLAKVPSELPQSIPFPVLFASTPHLYGDDASTSSHPAWRSSLWLLVNGASWNFDTPREVIADVYKNVSEALTPIRAITPTAAYFAESDVYEPDFEESYWGSNYARLLSIKNKYDPHHLLDCWHCVGWQGENHDRYKCYLPTESVLHTEPVEILSDQETIPSDKQSPFAKEHVVRSADEL